MSGCDVVYVVALEAFFRRSIAFSLLNVPWILVSHLAFLSFSCTKHVVSRGVSFWYGLDLVMTVHG